jgi:long-chain acyl-CoA synthetase
VLPSDPPAARRTPSVDADALEVVPNGATAPVVRPPGVPDEHPMPEVALPRLLDDAVRDLPDVEAIVSDRIRWSYGELAGVVHALVERLVVAGVGHGSRVRVDVAEPALRVALWWAVWRVGGAVVLARPLRRRTADAAAGVAVADGAALVRARAVARPGRRSTRTARLLATVEVAPAGSVPVAPSVAPDPDDVALVLVEGASVTTVSHRRLVAAAFQARLWVPDITTGEERCLVVLDTTSPTTLVLGPLATVLAAGTLVAADDGSLARVAARERATIAVVDRGGVARLAAARRPDLTALRVVLVDGGVGDPDDAVAWDDAAVLTRVSGGARVAGVTAAAGPLPTHAHPVYGHVDPTGIGLPLTSTFARVVDGDGRALAVGTAGRLVVDGPQLDGPTATPHAASVDERGSVRIVPDGAGR